MAGITTPFHLVLFYNNFVFTYSLTNVALNKPATQSSVHPTYGRPQNVVDGSTGNSVSQCTHSQDLPDPVLDKWWRVDLQGWFEVHAIKITNRGDCCGQRTADFDVLVSRALPDPLQSWPDNSAVCLHRGPQISGTERLDCTQPVIGRYVTWIRTNYDEPINFCELEVLGVPAVLVPIYRTTNYLRVADHRAPGDVIRETYARSVIHCTSACSKEPGCSAVNIKAGQTGSQGELRLCELLAYDVSSHPSALQPIPGWNFYLMNHVQEIMP